jgi:hypothetical protein
MIPCVLTAPKLLFALAMLKTVVGNAEAQEAVEEVGVFFGHLLLGHVLANLDIALLASTSASRRVA